MVNRGYFWAMEMDYLGVVECGNGNIYGHFIP